MVGTSLSPPLPGWSPEPDTLQLGKSELGSIAKTYYMLTKTHEIALVPRHLEKAPPPDPPQQPQITTM